MKILFIAAFLTVSAVSASAKEKTDTVKVLGNCESCKARIEKAAKAAGAMKADWSDETQILSVTYDDASTSLLSIEKGIAAVGHDTRDVKATAETYHKLHSCCQYDRTGTSGAKACEKKEN
jgi:periplasmic mercuric ion binding protein